MNTVCLVGRLTKDPEIRYTKNNLPVVSFVVAVDRDFRDNSGNRMADFLSCIAWRSTAEYIGKYGTKGRLICVSGHLQSQKYQEKDGKERYRQDVVADNVRFMDKKNAEENDGVFSNLQGDDSENPF